MIFLKSSTNCLYLANWTLATSTTKPFTFSKWAYWEHKIETIHYCNTLWIYIIYLCLILDIIVCQTHYILLVSSVAISKPINNNNTSKLKCYRRMWLCIKNCYYIVIFIHWQVTTVHRSIWPLLRDFAPEHKYVLVRLYNAQKVWSKYVHWP